MSLPDNFNDISLSRTFKMVDGRLQIEDSVDPGRQPVSPGGALAIGSVVESKYKILTVLGEGGMGVVYRALHLNLNKEIALKTFRSARVKPEAWGRFQREAVAISKLSHANIIQVFDFGISDQNVPYYTMELLSGQSLAEKLAQCPGGRLPLKQAVTIFSSVAAGLAHAHKHGTVHRDIKPANIFLEQIGSAQTVKIVDFGLAKLMQSQSLEGQQLTSEGLVFGSPLYMSPEQSLAQATDERTDIYSFGCSLYQALTGAPPFVGDSVLQTVMMHQTDTARTLAEACADGGDMDAAFFPNRLEALMVRLLAKDPLKRIATFEEVLGELSRIDVNQKKNTVYKTDTDARAQTHGSLPATPPLRAMLMGLALFVFAAVGIVLFVTLNSPPRRAQPVPAGAVLGLDKKDTAGSEDDPLVKGILSGADPSVPQGYYAHSVAGGARQFYFPEMEDGLGRLEWNGHLNERARGKVLVPAGMGVTLIGGKFLSEHPQLLRGFHSDDLVGLKCHGAWGVKQFKEIDSVSGIGFLDANKTDLNTASIGYLKVLSHLKVLHCGETELTGADLTTLPRLARLEQLDGAQLSDMGPAIAVLARNPKLRLLYLKGCKLNDEDMIRLCTIKQLNLLAVAFNEISMRGFRHVTELSNLTHLDVEDLKLTPEIISFLPRLKKLKHLELSLHKWSKADRERLQKALPHCTIDGNLPKDHSSLIDVFAPGH